MKPRVLILGASRYYVRCILAVREMGCETVVIDRNPQAEGFRHADRWEAVDITDREAALEVAQRYRVDAVVPINDFGVPTAAHIAQQRGLVGIAPHVAAVVTSKALMRHRWAAAGIPSARFAVVRSLEEAIAAAREFERWPLIFKPADSRGGGSRGVSRVDRAAEIPAAFAFAQQFYDDPAVVIEEFLEGVEHSAETIVCGGRVHVLAVSDKVKTPPPYRVDTSVIYPSRFTGAALQRIHEVCQAAVEALSITVGAAHVELVSEQDGPRLLEVGARCGGGGTPDPIMPYVTGIPMFQEVVRIALGELPRNLTPAPPRGCVYRFLTPPPGLVGQVTGVEAVRRWPNILDVESLVCPGEVVRPVRCGADRAGFLIAGGPTRAEAISLADQAERAISFVYERAA